MTDEYLPGVITTPTSLAITAISKSYPMVVSVIIDNASTQSQAYIPGMAVKLFVPKPYGMYQADGLVGTILDIIDLNFYLNIDSRYFDSFVVPVSGFGIPASIIPAGSINLEYSNTNVNYIPFKSLNNIGN